MKKQIRFIFRCGQSYCFFLVLFSCALFFSSCKKDISAPKLIVPFIEKVEEWLNKQKTAATALRTNGTSQEAGGIARNANIDLLKQNLDFNTAQKKLFNEEQLLYVIPIKEELKVAKKLDGNSILSLYLVMDKAENITSGGIVYFLPANGQKHTKPLIDAVFEIFQDKPISDEGVFKFLSVTGRWYSQVETREGKIYLIGNVHRGKQNSGRAQRANQICYDYYLVTTTYHADGTTTENWVFVDYVCEGCGQEGEYFNLCQAPDSGGGSTPPDEESEVDFYGTVEIPESDAEYAGAPKLDFRATYYIKRWQGLIFELEAYNIFVTNPVDSYIDDNGSPTIRRITLFGHNNRAIKMGSTGLISWFCYVHATYTKLTGVKTLQWTKSYTKVVS